MGKYQFFSSNFKLGILGGGQLGKMLLLETLRYDIYTKVMDPNLDSPCRDICNEFVAGDLTNFEEVVGFGENVDIVTIEIENVNTDALEYLEKKGKKVFPSSKTLRIIQNKSKQKDFYRKNKLPTSNYRNFSNLNQVLLNFKNGNISFPAVWKSAQHGYDGKGVKILNSFKDFNSLPDVECLVEDKISIIKEISIIIARNENNDETYFPVAEMEFNENSNLVEYIICPANISTELKEKAILIALKTAKKLKCLGLLAVELFITDKNEILINEVAPRPHNSGHHTIECCFTSQFDQHIRCILNLPLGSTNIKTPGIMLNLIGENKIEGNVVYQNINEVLNFQGLTVHIYGKKKSRLNRKMGHITIVNKDLEQAVELGKKVKNLVKVIT